MKAITLVLATLFFSVCNGQKTYNTEEGDTHLLGQIQIEDLQADPFGEWFNEKQDEKFPLLFADQLSDMKVDIYLGTWCGDSKKWVTKFVALWKSNDLPLENLSFVALHNEDELYKRTPTGIEKGLQIHRVPTFIFYYKSEEVGRIVESPINSLSRDIDQIAIGLPSKPRYRAASSVYEILENNEVDSLYNPSIYRPILFRVYKEVSRSAELNTLGYVLKAAGDIRGAEFAFYLNRNLFKHEPNTWDSLGEIYFEQGKYEDAKSNYEKVLELDPDNKNASEMLEKIKEKI